MRTCVSCSTASREQSAPPIEYASLNIASCAGEVPPSGFLHGGSCTIESRGMLTPTAHFRSAERCSTMAVSDRPMPWLPPMNWFSPSRVSDPRMRMFSGL